MPKNDQKHPPDDMRVTVDSMRGMLPCCIKALREFMTQPDAQELPEAYRRYFGKDSAISVLGKLVSMQKTLLELEEKERRIVEATAERTVPEMTDEDWRRMERAVKRWKSRETGI